MCERSGSLILKMIQFLLQLPIHVTTLIRNVIVAVIVIILLIIILTAYLQKNIIGRLS